MEVVVLIRRECFMSLQNTGAPEEWEVRRRREDGLPGPSEPLEGRWLECGGADAGAVGGEGDTVL